MKSFFAMVLLVLAVFLSGIDGNVQPALGEERLFLGAVKDFLSDDGFFTCRVCRKSYPFDDFFISHYQLHANGSDYYCCACAQWVTSYRIFSHTAEHRKTLRERHPYFMKEREKNASASARTDAEARSDRYQRYQR